MNFNYKENEWSVAAVSSLRLEDQCFLPQQVGFRVWIQLAQDGNKDHH